MHTIKLCSECGVPSKVGKTLEWNSGGEIYPKGPGSAREVFFETEVINTVFFGISETIGSSIDHIVIESSRRESIELFKGAFPAWMIKTFNVLYKKTTDIGIGKILGEFLSLVIKFVARDAVSLGVTMGSGKDITAEMVDLHGVESYRTRFVRNPYSPLLFAGDLVGTFEVFLGSAQQVQVEALGENTYKFIITPRRDHRELQERLKRRHFVSKPGSITYERCSNCGVPLEVAKYGWDLRQGTVLDPDYGVQLAVFSAFTLEAVLNDLEAELGELIPGVVIDTLTRYTKANMQKDSWIKDASAFKQNLAARGLGNLTRFEMGENRLSVTIENSCIHILMIGILQGVFELLVGKEAKSLDWNLSDEGVLEVSVACD